MFNALAQTKTLWMTFSILVLLSLCFGVVMLVGQFGIIDEMFVAEDIRAHIDAMTPRQRSLHVWLTGTIDVAYPFAYAGVFIGVAVKYFERWGRWLAIPSLLAIPADLTEGFAQIMLLNGHDNYMDLKVLMTPIKFGFFGFGLCVALIGLAIGLKRRLSKT